MNKYSITELVMKDGTKKYEVFKLSLVSGIFIPPNESEYSQKEYNRICSDGRDEAAQLRESRHKINIPSDIDNMEKLRAFLDSTEIVYRNRYEIEI